MDFVIVEVNGVDIRNMQSEETLALFNSLPEPITVKVLRRPPAPPQHVTSPEPDQSHYANIPLEPTCKSRTSSQTCATEVASQCSEANSQEHTEDIPKSHLFEFLPSEEEGEEAGPIPRTRSLSSRPVGTSHQVVVPKPAAGEDPGIRLSYALDRPGVFVSEVVAGSAAERSVEPGDQLCQINDHVVTRRSQAFHLLQQYSVLHILLTRPHKASWPVLRSGAGSFRGRSKKGTPPPLSDRSCCCHNPAGHSRERCRPPGREASSNKNSPRKSANSAALHNYERMRREDTRSAPHSPIRQTFERLPNSFHDSPSKPKKPPRPENCGCTHNECCSKSSATKDASPNSHIPSPIRDKNRKNKIVNNYLVIRALLSGANGQLPDGTSHPLLSINTL